MESRGQEKTWFVNLRGNHVAVSYEVYQLFRQENNRIRKQARAEFRCSQENYAFCHGDCQDCPWHTEGLLMSISEVGPDGNLSLASDQNVEEEVLSRLTMEEVYADADRIVSDGACLLRLRCEEGLSNREIADALGMSHTLVNKRMRILINRLRARAKKYF